MSAAAAGSLLVYTWVVRRGYFVRQNDKKKTSSFSAHILPARQSIGWQLNCSIQQSPSCKHNIPLQAQRTKKIKTSLILFSFTLIQRRGITLIEYFLPFTLRLWCIDIVVISYIILHTYICIRIHVIAHYYYIGTMRIRRNMSGGEKHPHTHARAQTI